MLESSVRVVQYLKESLQSSMLTTIALIYRCECHHWEFESVWKCLKAPESVIKLNRLYCTCILLALLRTHRSIFERVCCLPKIKTTKGSIVWGSRLNNSEYRSRIGSHGNFVKTKDILSRFKDHFWSLMLMMFHWLKCILLARTETICWTIQKRGMMWRFGFHKWFSTSNKNNMC